MADSDGEINVDDVCDSMAADHHGVEVETIIQGQAPMGGQADELDFMVQEEVETTTDGDTLTVELDPVDNVIIALQNTDNNLQSFNVGGHFQEQDGGEGEIQEQAEGSSSGRKRKGAGGKGGSKGYGVAKKKSRKSKRGSVRFTNRAIPVPLSTASTAKEAKEANEVSFDSEKRPRKWKKRKLPVKTLDGEFTVSMWATGMFLLDSCLTSVYSR